jgi:hypothetical protein
MQKNQATGNEQCRAAGLTVLQDACGRLTGEP